LQDSIRGSLSSTPIDTVLSDQHLVQELTQSETARTRLEDKIESLESQNLQFQESVAESRGGVHMLEAHLKQVNSELTDLRETHKDLEKR